MTVKELAEKLNLKIVAGSDSIYREINGCYVGDLMSLAMSKLAEDNIWITIQTNINVVAVSALADAACVLICDSQTPDELTVSKADLEGIPILTSEDTAYNLALEVGKLI